MHDILTPPTDSGCSKLSTIFPYRPGPLIEKRSVGLQRKRNLGSCRARLHGSGHAERLRASSSPSRNICQVTVWTVFVPNAGAQNATRSLSVDRFAEFIEEASARFSVPVRLIRAVMQVESTGDVQAISPRGAMGLMQLMPGTGSNSAFATSRSRSFDPRDNILAGTGYLKEMHDRFGSAGSLAAYHAGPARYEQYLATGQPLPPATIAYVAAVTALLGDGQAEHAAFRIRRALPGGNSPVC